MPARPLLHILGVKYLRRIVPVILSSVLVSGAAVAEKTIRAPHATTVAIMGDSAQALLWDSAKAEYQLVKAGDHFQGYFVVTIETDHVVVAELDNPKVRHVLKLTPAPTSRSGKAPAKPTIITLAPTRGLANALDLLDVLDPYSDDKLGLLDPYGAPPSKTARRARARPAAVEPTVVTAPPQSRATPAKPVAKPRAIGVPALPAKPTPTLAAEPDPEPEEPVEIAVRLQRSDLDSALSDFDRLSKEVQIERARGGGIRITGIAKGSFFYRAGLRKGDVVRAVAGERLTNMESAARVYARIQASDEFGVEVDRRRRRIIFAFALR